MTRVYRRKYHRRRRKNDFLKNIAGSLAGAL